MSSAIVDAPRSRRRSIKVADDVATPGPLADRGQAALVHVHNHDPAVRRTELARKPQQRVVRAVFEVREEWRPVEREQRDDDRRHQTGQTRQAGGTEPSSDDDFDAAIARLEHLVGRRNQQIRLAERRDFDDGASRPASTRMLRTAVARFSPSSKLTARDPVVSVCPTTTTSGTGRSLTACRISGTRARLSSVSSSDSKRKYRVKCRGGGGRADSASPNSRLHVSLAHDHNGRRRLVGATRSSTPRRGKVGGSRRVRDGRAPDRATLRIGEQHDQASDLGARARSNPLWPARPQRVRQRRSPPERRRRRPTVHSETRSASVVPRTPTIAAGVSRRMESGASLAIRPDT